MTSMAGMQEVPEAITSAPYIFNPTHVPSPEGSRKAGPICSACVHLSGPNLVWVGTPGTLHAWLSPYTPRDEIQPGTAILGRQAVPPIGSRAFVPDPRTSPAHPPSSGSHSAV